MLIQLIFQIVEVPVFLDVNAIKPFEFGLEPLILIHKCWFGIYQTLIPFLCSLKLRSFLLYLVLQVLLLSLHISNVLCEFCSTFILLLYDLFHASLDISLIVRTIGASAHTVKEIQSILSILSELGLSRKGVIQFCSKLANFVC